MRVLLLTTPLELEATERRMKCTSFAGLKYKIGKNGDMVTDVRLCIVYQKWVRSYYFGYKTHLYFFEHKATALLASCFA